MNRFKLLIIFLSLNLAGVAMVAPADSIWTTYKDGQFTTTCKIKVNASEEVTTSILNDFMYQFASDLDQLFTWGLKDMNLRGEGSDIILYNLKSSSYNAETKIIQGKLDAIVPNIITFRDISIEGKMYEKQSADKNKRIIQYDVLRTDGFIKEADAIFSMYRENEKEAWSILEVHVRFGWFFNIFITQKRYKDNLEWRFTQLAKNLKAETALREKKRKEQNYK